MEENQTRFPTDFQVEEEAYQKVLGSNTQVSHSLPAWETEADRWSKMADSWKQMIEDFLSRYMKTDKKLDLSWVDWELVLIIMGVILAIVLIALIVYVVSRFVRGQAEDLRYKQRFPKVEVTTRESLLITSIQEMMKQGEWSKAAKLRWRLFLERKQMASEVTPLEFEQNNASQLPRALEQYQNMFVDGKGDPNWYRQYSQKLQDLEGVQ